MKKSKKKIVFVASALSLAAFAIYSRKKFTEATKVVNNLKVDVSSVNNVNWQFPNVFFDAVLKISNPTNIDFGATLTSKIIIKKIRAYTSNGVLLGTAQTNVYSIDLPANSSTNLPSANVQVEGNNLLENSLNNLISGESSQILDVSGIKFKIDLEVFGKTITLDA